MSASGGEAQSNRGQDDRASRDAMLERVVADLAEQVRILTGKLESSSAGGSATGSTGGGAAGDAEEGVANTGGGGSAGSDRNATGDGAGASPQRDSRAEQFQPGGAGAVPAGVGPQVVHQGSGEARGFAPPGTIAAGGGGSFGPGLGPANIAPGTSAPNFFQNGGGFPRHQVPRITAPVFKGQGHSFIRFKSEFLQAAKSLYLDEVFIGSQYPVPVADPKKSRLDLLREGHSEQSIELGFQAWNFLVAALPNEPERLILFRYTSAKRAFEALEAKYNPTSEGIRQKLLDEFQSFKVSLHDDPITRLHAIEDLWSRMYELNITTDDPSFVYTRFLDALPREYGHTRITLLGSDNFSREDITRLVTTEHRELTKTGAIGRRGSDQKRGAEQALVSGGGGGGSGGGGRRSRKGGGSRQGGRSRGQASTGGGSSGGSPGGGGTTSSASSSSGSSGGGSGGGGKSGGKITRPEPRCFRCNKRGHRERDCTTEERDFVTLCVRCGGAGHTVDTCSSAEAVLAFEVLSPEDEAAVDAQAYAAPEPPEAKCSDNSVVSVGGGELAGQSQEESFILDSGAPCTMFTSVDGFVNYRECDERVRVAGKRELPVVGQGDRHIDDLLVGESQEEIDLLHANLNKKFTTNNLGECTYYDGCGIERDLELGTTTISQEAYTNSLISRFHVPGTSPTPASPGADLGPRRDNEEVGNWPVKEALGSLLWLSSMTRVDIASAVRAVARHAHAPTARHWAAIGQILRYLNGTRGLGITYVRGSWLGLGVFADAAYADHASDRRSVSGVAVVIGGTVVSHASKTHHVVSTSSTEAEHISGGDGVKEGLFVYSVLSFIAPETRGAGLEVFADNEGAIAMIQNPTSSARTKHIDVRFHFIRDLHRRGVISVHYVPTGEQRADMLTKPLAREKFFEHRNALMNLRV